SGNAANLRGVTEPGSASVGADRGGLPVAAGFGRHRGGRFSRSDRGGVEPRVLRAPVILLCGLDERVVEHRAPDGGAFTVRDLAAAIAETERQTRGGTNWFGGIDVHHVYFEGLMLDDDGVWTIGWGS